MGGHNGPDPVLSVVIPTYNRAALVMRAIRSALDQEQGHLEVIVIDDGSVDDTERIIASVDDPRLRYLRQRQAGATAARNRGASVATGTNLVFLDSDDELAPGWAEAFGAAMTGTVRVASSDCWRQAPTGERQRGCAWDLGFVAPDVQALFQSGTYAVASDLFRSVGGFDEELASGHHTDLAFRLLPRLDASKGEVVHIGEPLVLHHLGAPHSIRRNDTVVLQGTEQLIGRHQALLRRNPKVLADYHGVAGVAAARLGDRARARRHFALAARHAPMGAKRWARLLLVSVPGGSAFWDRGGE